MEMVVWMETHVIKRLDYALDLVKMVTMETNA